MELLVHFVGRPGEAFGVLGHFEAAGCHAAGVGGLSGGVEEAVALEDLDGTGGGRHVRAFADHLAAVGDEGLGVVLGDFVLGCGGIRAVALHAPRTRVLEVLHALGVVGVLLDAAALDVLELLDPLQLLLGDALRIIDRAVGVGHGDGLGAQLDELLDGELGDVAGAGDRADLAFQGLAAGGEHLLGEVHRAVAGGLGAHERAAPVEALAGQHAGEGVGDALVLSEEVADFAAAHADVACGHVGVRPDVAVKLGHEGLAEAHDLGVGLALRVEVGAALSAAHREGGEGVLEDLLEAEELEDGGVHAGMEAEAALVRSDRVVELEAEAAVDLNLAGVVLPGDAEGELALRLHEALEDAVRLELRVAVQGGRQGGQHFVNGLEELRLVRVAGRDFGHDFCDVVLA